ncbi:GumC family protein [Oscillatoria salina]|uniref:GumC family protein n=1 Tax=Oscillatoria salina TaxID=331517 RepID=UPI0013B6CAA6|nr:polysaccharide biosynthesis tyrosine autokinase [Oscillatoria salina]MBZ8179782.1 polysaccharide biosynthesis tyrosine autokinase [Oscillatoria salina IIICB1]NET87707.1 polysaccharide biosynthesis tyrosine autokinase [Kamptonema sp. SIO1D9]
MISNRNSQSISPNWNGKQLPPQLPPTISGLAKEEEESFNPSKIFGVLRRRWWLIGIVTISVSAVVGVRVFQEEPIYQSRFQVLVGQLTNEQINPLAEQAGVSTKSVDYETQIQVLSSPKVLSPILEKIKAEYPNYDYSSLSNNLKINRLGQTQILEVRYQDSNPEKVKIVLDRVAAGYINYSLNEQQSGLQQGLEFTEDQLPQLQERVDKLQERLQIFRQQYDLIEPQSQGQQLSGKLSAIKQQQQETQAQLAEIQSLSVRLSEQLGLEMNEAITASALSAAPRYQELLNQLQQIETQIALESARLTEISPQMQRLQEQRANLLPLLQQEARAVLGTDRVSQNAQSMAASPNPIRLQLTQQLIEATNQRQILEVRQVAIALAENQARQELQKMAAVIREYTDLQRELQVATESLNRFLTVRETLKIEEAQKATPWQLISNPFQPSAPISPDVPRGLLIGGMAGLLAGIGAAMLAEKFDNRFHSPDDLKEITGLALLGTIPYQKQVKGQTSGDWAKPSTRRGDRASVLSVTPAHYHSSPFLDAFRSLHANLYFISPDRPLRSLAISSSVPAEGKSTTSVNLAQAAAAMGQRVLLVDADLRRPQIHIMMDLPNVWGLSHVISTDIEVNDVIQRSPGEDNLYILSAGQIPPDPTRLLSSQKMRNLIQQLQESFDLVIFDTPPLLGLVDAKLLAAHTDGIVMVVGLGQADQSGVKQVLDGLKMSHTKVLGAIANGVKGYTPSSSSYYQRYYRAENQTSSLNGNGESVN